MARPKNPAFRIDWDRFLGSVLSPRRARAEEAVALARSEAAARKRFLAAKYSVRTLAAADARRLLTEPDVVSRAWEALCTRLDADRFFDDSTRDGRRVFAPFVPVDSVDLNDDGVPEATRALRVRGPVPYELETAVAFLTCRAEDVLTAEELALEAAARLRPWGARNVQRVAWRLIDQHAELPAEGPSSFFQLPMVATPEVSAEALAAAGMIGAASLYDADGPWAPRTVTAARCLSGWMRWHESVADGDRVPSESGAWVMPPGVVGRRFASLPDPIEPVLSILGLGFMPIDVLGDAVILGVTLPKPERRSEISGPSLRALAEQQRVRYGARL